jgi:formylglycine-generating enzyme required for sulfatase activity
MTRVAIVVVIAFTVFLVFFWPLPLALMRYGDVAKDIRVAVLERSLTGLHGGIAAILPNGASAILKASDVGAIGDSHCKRESKCYGARRACQRVYVWFNCGFDVTLRDGRNAKAFLRLGASQYFMPQFSTVTAEDFSADDLNIPEAAGFICGKDVACYARLKPAPTPETNIYLDRDCKDGFCAPAMVRLEAGQFRRGSTPEELDRLRRDYGLYVDGLDDEEPAMMVTIARPFAMGRYEVTAGEWRACIAEKACPESPISAHLKDTEPMSDVSWQDVTGSYLPWLNGKLGLSGSTAYRLPTEAEWEYAARGGTTSRHASGDLLDSHHAHYFTFPYGPSVVGQYLPNGFGLHDMAGNLRELVQDCHKNNYVDAPVDGSAHDPPDCRDRMVRGGTWQTLPVAARPAYRSFVSPTERREFTGFRLARSLP